MRFIGPVERFVLRFRVRHFSNWILYIPAIKRDGRWLISRAEVCGSDWSYSRQAIIPIFFWKGGRSHGRRTLKRASHTNVL